MSPNASVIDMDSTMASSLQIIVLDVFPGDSYFFPESPTLELNEQFEGSTGVITYNGTETIEVYMNLLTSIEFSNTLDEPRDGDRRLTVQLFAPTDLQGIYLESNVAEVTINVLPLNDNDPMFSQDTYNGSVVENSPNGTVTGVIVMAMDADVYGDTSITYEIVEPGTNNFRIDTNAGIILTNQVLDAEVTPFYSFSVVAQDNDGESGRSGTANVYIEVIDLNDNRPAFNQISYTVSVSEDLAVQDVVLQVTASDMDRSPINSNIRYDILPPEQGSGVPVDLLPESPSDFVTDLPFAINPLTGEISLTQSLDYESAPQFSFTVRASDSGSPQMTGTAQVIVIITDANDNVPQFTNTPYSVALNESEPVSNVLVVSAVDADSGSNGQISYSLSGAELFSIDATTGVISLVRTLDYELQSTHNFTVIASDSGSPQRFAEEPVYIIVQNINDNVPRFTQDVYQFDVFENSELNVQVFATDEDEQQVTFLPTFGFSPNFELDPFTGVILSVEGFSFDYEQQQQFMLVVEATDDVFSNFANVTINILDQNDLPPVFESTSYMVVINESLPIGSSILQVRAEDRDSGSNAEIEYILDSSQSGVPFSVNQQTGNVVVASTLDFDNLPVQYVFSVIAQNTAPPYFNDTTTVTVELTDVNDIRPILNLNQPNLVFVENSDSIQIAANIVVTDADSTLHPITMCSVVLDRELCDSPGVDICHESVSVDEAMTSQIGLTVNVFDEIENQTIILSGSASEAVYQQILASLEYSNMALEPNRGARSVTIQCFDGDFSSNVLEISIDVQLVNEFCPVISASQVSFNYTEESGALQVGNLAGFMLSDQDSAPHNTLMQLQVTLSNRLDGEYETISAADTPGLDVVLSNNVGSGAATVPDTLSITATGPASLSTYVQFLQSLVYENTRGEPTSGLRYIEVSPIDSSGDCRPLLLNVSIALLNDNPPIVSAARNVSYYEGSGALAFALEAGLMVRDADNNQLFPLQSSTVTLEGVMDRGMEMLDYDSSMLPSGVSVSRDDNSPLIRVQLSGSATVQEYEAALLSLTYTNNASEPTPGNRTVTITVSDGIQQDVAVVIVIVILVDDNALSIQPSTSQLVFTEGQDNLAIGVMMLVDVDRDPVIENLTITLTGSLDQDNEFLSVNTSSVTNEALPDGSVIRITTRSPLENYQVRQNLRYNNVLICVDNNIVLFSGYSQLTGVYLLCRHGGTSR